MEITIKNEPMLFNYETTYKNDFRFGEIRDTPKIIYNVKKLEKIRDKVEYKNIHTLTQWQREVPPFSLLHKPKGIVRTNPNDVQQYIEKRAVVDIKEARRTRPRLVMPPAVSMDDIEDEHARDILCTDMYTSNMTQEARGIVAPVKKTPKLGRLFPANPITLAKLQPSYVSPEWRMETVTWDKEQLRGYFDPTKEFWIKQKVKSPDVGWELAKDTRPRLVMTPAVRADDVTDPGSRKILIEDIYTTTAQRAMREGIADAMRDDIKAPLPGPPACSNPITLEKFQPPYVPPEWRMDSVSWDGRQLRGCCDPDKEFYLRQPSK